MTPWGAALTIFCLLGAAATSLYVGFYGSQRAFQDRFDEMALKLRAASEANPLDESGTPENFTRTVLRWAMARVPRPKSHTPAVEKLTATLVRAGYLRANAVRTFQAIRLLAIMAGTLLGLIAGLCLAKDRAQVMMAAVVGAAIGAYAPGFYLKKRAIKRQKIIARELSDVLDLLVVCVDAGLGLFEAIKVVGEETEQQGQEIGGELSLVAGEAAAGLSLGQALRNLAHRTAVEDVRPLAATLIQSEQLGAQIGPALRSSSDAMRARRRIKAEEAAQKSTIKILFPLVLFILPAMLLVIIAPAIIQAMRTLH
ncbi:MAG: type II secretion system F family protein [Candidatus Binataceae bacterium]